MEASTPGVAPSSDNTQGFERVRSCRPSTGASIPWAAALAVQCDPSQSISGARPTSDEEAVAAILARIGTERGAAGISIRDVLSALLESAAPTGLDRPSSQLPPGSIGIRRLEAWLSALIEGYARGRELRRQPMGPEEKATRRAAIAAVEQERARIARELHDEAGQLLVAAVFHLDQALTAGHQATTRRSVLQNTRELLIECSRSLHRLSEDLRPPILTELGLAAALQWLVRKAHEQYGFVIDIQLGEIPAELDREIELAVFRVAQETITNAARHGRPTRVVVAVECADGQIEITVRDDGIGFTPEPPTTPLATPDGRLALGVFGLKERVSALGGALEIQSRPGQGTTVTARLPLGGDVSRAA